MTLLREPLIHFLLIGAGLFWLASLMNDNARSESDEIVVSAARIEQLAQIWAKTWQRPPTRDELEGLIEDYIREEVLYRQALAMQLDEGDVIVRRRLRQKLEFLADELVSIPEPTDAELQAYLVENGTLFRVEPSLSLRHVYVNTDRRGERARTDAAGLLEELKREGDSADPAEFGDSLSLPHTLVDESASEIGKLFGERFAAAVLELPIGTWAGPIASGYGLHLVRVDERIAGRMPELAEVRDRVRREWERERQARANEAFYDELRARYTITVERPEWAQPASAE